MENQSKINPLWGQRLSELLDEANVKQKDLAKRIGYTQQHISKIKRGKAALVQDVAEAISKEAPIAVRNGDGIVLRYEHVRVQWLLGLDSIKTESEMLIQSMEGKDASFRSAWILLDDALQTRAQTLTYHPDPVATPDNDNLPINSLPSFGDFIIEDRATQKKIFKMSQNQMYELQRELTRYAGFLIDGMMQKGEYNDGEH